MYRLTICTLRWPVWFMMERSDAPAIAALVAWPARSEWPAYLAGSRPARTANFFTTLATSAGAGGQQQSAMAIDGAEHRACGKASLPPATLSAPHRAGFGIAAVGNANLPACAVLVGFAAAQSHREAIFAEVQIRNIEPDDL